MAGDGTITYDGNGPALERSLYWPRELAAGPDGALYVGSESHHVVRRIADGVMTTIAGGPGLPEAESGVATEQRMWAPRGIAVGADGTVYVTEHVKDVVRAIAPDGTISVVAGTWGVAGAGAVPAAGPTVALNDPVGLTSLADGRVLIAENGRRVLSLETDGTLIAFAGSGVLGHTGDGGPATAARIGTINGMVERADGRVVLSVETYMRLREVAPGGTISTPSGDGTRSSSTGDGGPASAASLNLPGRGRDGPRRHALRARAPRPSPAGRRPRRHHRHGRRDRRVELLG